MPNIHSVFKGVRTFIRRRSSGSALRMGSEPARSIASRKPSARPGARSIAWSVMAMACAMSQAQAPKLFPASTAVGQSSQPLSVTVTMSAGGVTAAPQALTQGVANMDFAVASGGTCTAGATYSVGQQCTAMIVFQPEYPGLRIGAVRIETSDGRLMGTALLAGLATGPLPVLAPGSIDTIAGDDDWLYQGDGGLATASPIFLPTGVVADAAGNVFISDSQNDRIRRVDGQTKSISTVAGTGSPGYEGTDVLAAQTAVNTPSGLALDGAGDLYFADTGNHIIRRIDAVTGLITTVAGTPGVQGYTGDGEAATQAELASPEGIAFDEEGDLFIADTGNNVIREVDAVTGIISTVAGTGVAGFNGDNQAAAAAQLNTPWSVTVGQDGSLYIADLMNNRVRKVSPSGVISTIAGTGARGFMGDGGSSTLAELNEPTAIAIDPAGDMYIADSDNNRVREIDASTGIIETICGTASEGFSGDGGPANLASLYGPYSLFFDESGNVYIADLFNNRIRRMNALTLSLQYATIKVGQVSAPQAVALANDGNTDLVLAQPSLLNALEDAATTTCTVGANILSAGTCSIGADFAPTEVGDPILGSITVNTTSANTAPVLSLSGQVLSITPTTTALTSNANPSLAGATVLFTATINNGGSSLTGTVVFLDGSTQLCSVTVSGDSASCNTSSLALGQHSITASYSGDTNNASSSSGALIQVVKQKPTLTLTVTPNPAAVNSNVTLTFTAAAPTGIPSGAVTFYDGTTALLAANLSSSGSATYSTTQFSVGTHSLSVQYAGDASNISGTSNVVSEVVQQATTSTTLTSSSPAAAVGSQVTLTATVTSADGLVPTGSIQFMDGSTVLGSSTVGSGGAAVVTLTSLAPGTYSIVAVYSGDTDDATSTSAPVTETIQQVLTTTALSASLNPISVGATLNLTAAVATAGGSMAGGALTGEVTFSEGSTVYGSVALNGTGMATLSLSTLPVGTHRLIASYAGNTDYASSVSAVLVEVVQTTGTTTGLSSTSATTLAGQPATFTAAVSSATAGIPTGTVTFYDGAVSIGQETLSAQGVATLTTSALAVGTHNITAIYNGDSNYTTSTSAPLQHIVNLAIASLTLAGPVAPVDAGTTFAVTATLSSNGTAPTGTLTLRNGNTTIATKTVAADGTFTFSGLGLTVGTYQLTAVYGGDSNNAGANSPAVTVIVQLTPTATSLISSANPATLGQPVTFTATVSGGTPAPSGSIEFMDGTAVLGSATVNGSGSASLTTSTLAFGMHSITASYLGDTDHAVSSSSALSEKILEGAAVSLTSSVNPSIFGTNVLFSVEVAGVGAQTPTGTVILRDGTTVLSTLSLNSSGAASLQTASLAVGSHAITASYSGDSNYTAASTSLVQTVQSATTQIALTASANPAIYAAPVTFTATVTGNGGIATGSVNFTDGGVSIGSGSLNAAGIAQLTLSTLAPGTHSIVANYAGDSNISASSSTPQVVLVKELTSVALASNANPEMTLNSLVLTATVGNSGIGQPTGTITFMDGSTLLGTAPLHASGVASLTVAPLSAGNHSLLASYAGDNDNFGSTSPEIMEGIELRPTTVAITSSSTDPSNPQQITLISEVGWSGPVTPTGTVTFTSGTTVVGSTQVDAIGIATLNVVLASSAESIIATYNGDANYASSSSFATSISGGVATQFTMQLTPSNVSFPSEQHATIGVSLASLKGFSDTLQLGCLGLPYAATCTFSTPQPNLAANGTATVQLVIDTGDPLGAGATATLDRRQSSGVLLCFLPCLWAIGFGTSRRKMRASTLLLLVCMVAMTLSAVGCSGLHMSGTPPGTYSFKVTASGEGSGATVSQTATLTVTQ